VRKLTLTLVVVAAAGLATWYFVSRGADDAAAYRFVEVRQGDIEAIVSSTGTLEALRTVDVGTQVSGQVAEMLVDFNDRVTRGQLIARIDPTILEAEIRAAEASMARTRAEAEQRRVERERAESLHADGLATDSDLDAARANDAVARANVLSGQVALDRARRNLAYTEIRAPIDGVVVSRNVDVGQTVAASLSAPTLFRIAEDLSRMRIIAAVDESDIGEVREGTPVRFTVQAHPDDTFTGTLRQVRLQSTVQENVVKYGVVIDVGNPENKLRPGMTATVSFVLDAAKDVFVVPSSALRFRPTEAMMAELRARRGAERGGDGAGPRASGEREERRPGDAAGAVSQGQGAWRGRSANGGGGAGGRPGNGGAPGAPSGRPRRGARAMLFTVDERGKLDVVRVTIGLSNGRETQVEGDGLRAGLKVIAGVTSSADTASASPFQPQRPQGPGGRPPGMF
jgi:HlyD family secretion protein